MTQENEKNEKKQEKTIKERVKAVLDAHQAHQLSSWERHTFLPSISRFSILSQKQQAILDKIELRIELSGEPYVEDSYNS